MLQIFILVCSNEPLLLNFVKENANIALHWKGLETRSRLYSDYSLRGTFSMWGLFGTMRGHCSYINPQPRIENYLRPQPARTFTFWIKMPWYHNKTVIRLQCVPNYYISRCMSFEIDIFKNVLLVFNSTAYSLLCPHVIIYINQHLHREPIHPINFYLNFTLLLIQICNWQFRLFYLSQIKLINKQVLIK